MITSLENTWVSQLVNQVTSQYRAYVVDTSVSMEEKLYKYIPEIQTSLPILRFERELSSIIYTIYSGAI